MAEPAEGEEEVTKDTEGDTSQPKLGESEPKKDIFNDESTLLEDFNPVPYLFLLKDANGDEVSLPPNRLVNARIECPRFHILIDHLMAVLWCYYSKNGLDLLESNQIHWALKILEGQRNSIGQYTEDVQMAINHLTDAYVDVCSKTDVEKLQNRTYEPKPETSFRKKRKPAAKDKDDTTIAPGNFEEDLARQIELQNASIHLADMVSDADADDIRQLVVSDDPAAMGLEGMVCINKKVLLAPGQDPEAVEGEQKEMLDMRNKKFQTVVEMLEEIRKLDETIQQMPSTRGEALQSMLDPILKKPEGDAEGGKSKPEEEAAEPEE